MDSHGEFHCLDSYTGGRIWENLEAVPKARWANIHMVRPEDTIWMFNERAELTIAVLSPEGLNETKWAKIIQPTERQLGQRGGVCWAHPAFAYKRIYVRNARGLLCMDLSIRQ